MTPDPLARSRMKKGAVGHEAVRGAALAAKIPPAAADGPVTTIGRQSDRAVRPVAIDSSAIRSSGRIFGIGRECFRAVRSMVHLDEPCNRAVDLASATIQRSALHALSLVHVEVGEPASLKSQRSTVQPLAASMPAQA